MTSFIAPRNERFTIIPAGVIYSSAGVPFDRKYRNRILNGMVSRRCRGIISVQISSHE